MTPKAEEESGLTRPAAASASWDRILAEYKQLYDAGDYGPALEKIREGEDDFRDDTEKMAVVDRAVDDCSKMLDERWPKDEAKILDFAGQGEIEKALAVARAATRYGDPQIQRQAAAMMRDIKSQAIARGVGSGGDDDDEGGKAKESDDDDVDFDDLDDDDDDSGE